MGLIRRTQTVTHVEYHSKLGSGTGLSGVLKAAVVLSDILSDILSDTLSDTSSSDCMFMRPYRLRAAWSAEGSAEREENATSMRGSLVSRGTRTSSLPAPDLLSSRTPTTACRRREGRNTATTCSPPRGKPEST